MEGYKIVSMTISVLIILVSMVTVKGQFDPLLNVESCTKSKLVVSTFGAVNDGIIYIQDQGEQCRQTTRSGMALHEFDFQECDIQWEMLFKIVIQQHAGYQTGGDKQIPIFCIPDKSDIIVDNSNQALDKSDDAAMNLTVKPSASMSFYKTVSAPESEVSGSEVMLTDRLIMVLQLDDQWTADFDISARYCVASDIVIIDNFCASEPDLFPNFYKLRTGYLMSEFGAFRTSDGDGGPVLMNFTCVLQVCKDNCVQNTCNRKRRDATRVDSFSGTYRIDNLDSQRRGSHFVKRQVSADNGDNAGVSDIDVGGKIKIVEKYSNIRVLNEDTTCLNIAVLIVVLIFLSVGVIGFASASVILYRKWTGALQAASKETS